VARIGIFDSGLGGLTVVRAVEALLPGRPLVYLGDTARVPYGTRSPRTVVRYARGCAQRLAERGIDVLVVACNTVSAVALDALRAELDVPVIGVVEPGAEAAVAASRTGRIGLLATAGTVASGAYPRAVGGMDSRAELVSRAAPLFVPLVEEGWLAGEVPRLAARRYLAPLVDAEVDTILLGCTHYPLLADVIADEAALLAGRRLAVVDGSAATAEALVALVRERFPGGGDPAASPRTGSPGPGGAPVASAPVASTRLLVTDLPAAFRDAAARFLGRPLADDSVEQIDL
jgi:glutamate racemase